MAKNSVPKISDLVHGICPLNVIPVFDKPLDVGVMISQLLYGETFNVIQKKNKYWIKIQSTFCSVAGWVRTNQIQLITESTYYKLSVPSPKSLEISHPVFNEVTSRTIVLGSILPHFDGISLVMPDGKYIFNGQATNYEGLESTPDLIVKIAKKYIHAPELKGGRTPFGIDSGALIQLVYSFFHIVLPRYPEEQSNFGEEVDFVDLAQEGDLAFFKNKDNIITHVGLIIGDRKILHVNGSVRIDNIDHLGIFNSDLKRYTHKLRIVKRLIAQTKEAIS